MTIIELLQTEHAVFNVILNEIEVALPQVATLGELRLIVRLVARFLRQHGHKEEELLCPAIDQMQVELGEMTEMAQEHVELDRRILQVARTRDLGTALKQFDQIIQAVRQHFDYEERRLFPLAEKVLQSGSLMALGGVAEQTITQAL
ncbi:MAG: hemerythrin domain-containing protein [Limisphaerales bacterium]